MPDSTIFFRHRSGCANSSLPRSPAENLALPNLYYVIVARLGAKTFSSVTFIPPIVALLVGETVSHELVSVADVSAAEAILGGLQTLSAAAWGRVLTLRTEGR